MSNPVNKALAVHYSPEVALAICTEIASGKTLVEVCELEGMPSRNSVYKWLSVYPKFYDAYERAKEISAQSLEDEALLMARNLKDQVDFTGTKVQAYNIAMQQLRWSAARRDPNRYGQKMNSTSVVPIQITTTLNLGQDGQPPGDAAKSIYTVEIDARVGQPSQPPPVDTEDYVTIDAEANTGDTDDLPFGLPQEETQQLHNPPAGRPKGTHKGVAGRRKSAASIEKTARIYAANEQKRLAAKAAKTAKKDTE